MAKRELTVWEAVAQTLNEHCGELKCGPFFTSQYVEKSLAGWVADSSKKVTVEPKWAAKEWFESMFERGRGGPVTVGKVVLYVGTRGVVYPAIITGVVSESKVDLRVFSSRGPDFIETGVEFRAARHAKEWSWHWPEQ